MREFHCNQETIGFVVSMRLLFWMSECNSQVGILKIASLSTLSLLPLVDGEIAYAQNTEDHAPYTSEKQKLSIGERIDLAMQIQRCWVVDPESSVTSVTVEFRLSKDGKVENGIINLTEYDAANEEEAEVVFQSARRAILRCAQNGLKLPDYKYPAWKHVEMTFDISQR